ncbi:hypothetical protein GJ496_005325 [Pomphorhynchus laevis]|nr:hypothetical protein GJ496_005325 [Pomphorhynchus laevis]
MGYFAAQIFANTQHTIVEDQIIPAGTLLNIECPKRSNWLEYNDGDEFDHWQAIGNLTSTFLENEAEVDQSGYYRCRESTKDVNSTVVTTKAINVTVYSIQVSWYYSCPTNGTAGCYLLHEQEKLSVLENSTITLGCSISYVNVPNTEIQLEVNNEGPFRNPVCDFQTVTPKKSSSSKESRRDPSFGTISCSWPMSVEANDAERKIDCIGKQDYLESSSQMSFVIEVRNSKYPHQVIKRKHQFFIWAQKYHTLLAFVIVIFPAIFIPSLVICLRRLYVKKYRRHENRYNRKSSLIIPRSTRRMTVLGRKTTLFDYVEKDDMSNVPSLPRRPPPRVTY